MIERRTLGWRIAKALAAHAARILPVERQDWSRAMLHELHYLPRADTAIRWALGCVLAGYIDRINTMNRSLKRVSRWVLSLEALLCFGPVTWLCVAVLSSLVKGAWSAADALLYVSATLIGPMGLAIAVRTALLKQTVGRAATAAMCVLASWTFLAYSGLIVRNEGGLSSDGWRSFVLIALLPALASAHLLYLAHETRRERAAISA
jgi:hypothetical protein